MDVGNRVTQEQLPKILTTRVVRSLDCARDDRMRGNAHSCIYVLFASIRVHLR